MTECNTNNCALNIGNYRLYNNKWGSPNSSQSIFVNSDNTVGFSWNNSQGGWNYPEIVAGTARNCGGNTWPGGPFPFTQSNLNSCSTQITYKFTQKPTNWWNFAFDVYWMKNTTQCDTGKMYNIMVWIHGLPQNAGTLVKDNISDGYNTWTLYHMTKPYGPWYGLLLKNRNNIPYEPVLNQQYSIKIDLKKLFDAVGGINGSWYLPGIELGCENSATSGPTSGKIQIITYNLEVNGKTIGLGATPLPVLTTISISPEAVSIGVSSNKQLTSICKDQNNNTMTCPALTWTSSSTSIATINSSGLITGVSPGTANIIASASGKTSNISVITVTPEQPTGNLLINSGFELPSPWSTYSTGNTQKYSYPEPGRIGGSSVAIQYVNRENGKFAAWIQSANIDNKKTYKFSGYLKTENIDSISTNYGATIYVDWKDASGNWLKSSGIMTAQVGTMPWTYFEGTVTPVANSAIATAVLSLRDCAGKAWFDDISLNPI